MRIKGILFLASMLLLGTARAQELKTFVNPKGKVGYADANGKEVIKCQYDGAFPFKNGVAIVSKSGKSGMIDKSGKVILPLKYSQITSWSDDVYLIKMGKTMGLADSSGKVLLPAKYTMISKANVFGKALISTGGKAVTNENKKKYLQNAKYGVIDGNGNILVAPKYKGLYEFAYAGINAYPYHEGKRLQYSYHCIGDTLVTDCKYLGFSQNGLSIVKAGIIDEKGKVLLKTGLFDYVMMPYGNMVRYYNAKKKETLAGYYNIETSKSFQVMKFDTAMGDMNYWSHGDFAGDLAPVNGKTWSFIDKTGKVVRSNYKEIDHCIPLGLWTAKTASGKWEVFTENNENVDILSSKYQNIKLPRFEGDRELFVVQKDGKYGAITKNGDVVIPFEYDNSTGNTHDYIGVQKNGKWGLLSANNDQIVSIDYDNVIMPLQKNCKDFWVMKSDSLYYHYNAVSSSLSTNGFKIVTNFVDGIAVVVPKSMIIRDCLINKAQVYSPNTNHSVIEKVELDKIKDSFGYLYGDNDVMLFDSPVSSLYLDDVKKRIVKKGNKPISQSEKKSILLDITRNNRSYSMKGVISEDEWDY